LKGPTSRMACRALRRSGNRAAGRAGLPAPFVLVPGFTQRRLRDPRTPPTARGRLARRRRRARRGIPAHRGT